MPLDFPTPQQTFRCFDICSGLTRFYIPIYLVRWDASRGEIYILAGDTLEFLIDPDGQANDPNQAEQL